MRYFFFILFAISFNPGFAQKKIDGEFIFKDHLFLEKAFVRSRNGFETKGRELFSYFNENIKLTLDTLGSVGFPYDYIFLHLPVKNGITYNEKALKSDSAFYLFIADNCTSYVLAINKANGRSYRLKGFAGNDFLSLYSDIRRRNENMRRSQLGMKAFLKDCGIDSLDLYCLYHAFKNGTYDATRYPCLKTCETENNIIH